MLRRGCGSNRTRRTVAAALLLAAPLLAACGLRVPSATQRSALVAAEGGGSNTGDSAPVRSTGGASGGPVASPGAGGSQAATGSGPIAGSGGSTGAGASAAAAPVVGAAAPAGGNGGPTDVGVTADSITIGNVSDLGGPVPGLFEGGPYGTQAYFDYVNSQGGVFGRRLKLVTADDALECSQNEAAYQNLVKTVFGFVGSWSLDDNCGAQVLAGYPDIPLTNEALTPQAAALPGQFSENPFGEGAPLGPFEYFKSKYPNAIAAVGTLVGNQPAAVAAWGYSRKAMESLGYKVIYEDDFPPAQSNFEPDVVRMRADGVKMVYLISLNAPDAADFAAEAAQQNWHPEVFACAVCYTASFIQSAGGASSVEGMYLNVAAVRFLGEDAPAVPEVATFLHWLKADYPNFPPDQFSAYSWANAALFVQALRSVGPHLTRAAVVAALRATHAFDDNGLMAPSDAGSKKPANCYLMLRVIGGQYEKVDDPASGFRCDAPYFQAG